MSSSSSSSSAATSSALPATGVAFRRAPTAEPYTVSGAADGAPSSSAAAAAVVSPLVPATVSTTTPGAFGDQDLVSVLPMPDETGSYPDDTLDVGEGIMFDVEPRIWGRHYWAMIHLTAYAYPEEPTIDTRQAAYQWLDALRYILPCGGCREHFRQLWQKYPIEEYLNARETFIEWTEIMHDAVNRDMKMPPFDLKRYLNALTGTEAVVDAPDAAATSAADAEETTAAASAAETTVAAVPEVVTPAAAAASATAAAAPSSTPASAGKKTHHRRQSSRKDKETRENASAAPAQTHPVSTNISTGTAVASGHRNGNHTQRHHPAAASATPVIVAAATHHAVGAAQRSAGRIAATGLTSGPLPSLPPHRSTGVVAANHSSSSSSSNVPTATAAANYPITSAAAAALLNAGIAMPRMASSSFTGAGGSSRPRAVPGGRAPLRRPGGGAALQVKKPVECKECNGRRELAKSIF